MNEWRKPHHIRAFSPRLFDTDIGFACTLKTWNWSVWDQIEPQYRRTYLLLCLLITSPSSYNQLPHHRIIKWRCSGWKRTVWLGIDGLATSKVCIKNTRIQILVLEKNLSEGNKTYQQWKTHHLAPFTLPSHHLLVIEESSGSGGSGGGGGGWFDLGIIELATNKTFCMIVCNDFYTIICRTLTQLKDT